MASAITALGQLGIDGVAMWHAKGNAYGLIDSDDRMRATGQLYALSPWLTGRIAEASLSNEVASSDGPRLLAVPVLRADGGQSLLFANQHEAAIHLNIDPQQLASTPYRITIDADGLWVQASEPGQLELPGWSVTLLLDKDPALPLGRTALPGQHVTFDW